MANFNEILERARQRKEEAESRKGSGSSNYLYPGDGKTSFRLLFNPATNNIFRGIARHWSDDLKKHVPCLSMYGLPCPICEVKKMYKEETGKDAGWKLDPQKRVLFHATFREADNPSNDKLKEGDTMIVMTAPSIENEFNKLFVDDLADGLDQIFTAPSGMTFTLKKYKEGNFTRYDLVTNPLKKTTSAESDEDMLKLLEGLPEITELYFPKECTEDVKRSVMQVAESEMKKWGIQGENKVLNDMKGSDIPPIPGN